MKPLASRREVCLLRGAPKLVRQQEPWKCSPFLRIAALRRLVFLLAIVNTNQKTDLERKCVATTNPNSVLQHKFFSIVVRTPRNLFSLQFACKRTRLSTVEDKLVGLCQYRKVYEKPILPRHGPLHSQCPNGIEENSFCHLTSDTSVPHFTRCLCLVDTIPSGDIISQTTP